jgi:uncharacterized protein (DUF427 family)
MHVPSRRTGSESDGLSQGDANYYKVSLPSGEKDGLAWWYKTPISESLEIKGLIAFYDEKVDVWVDGVKQKRPVTHFA